jgi:Fe-S-cluster containining protein
MTTKKQKKGNIAVLAKKLSKHKQEDEQCTRCLPAKCCMYFSLEIDAPENKRDYDDFLWFLAHENVSIYLFNDDWFLMLHNKCKFINKESNLCTIYDTRPKMCREHTIEDCEFDSDYEFDEHFKSYDDLKRWMKKQKIIK